jgi:hypothetical protein
MTSNPITAIALTASLRTGTTGCGQAQLRRRLISEADAQER